MSKPVLRKYQETLVRKISKARNEGKRKVVVASPTGSGKTVIFSYIAHSYDNVNKKVLVITHRRELLQQADGAFTRFNIRSGFITANSMHLPNENVVIAMVETINRRLKDREHYRELLETFDLIILDESHRGEHDKLFKYFTPEMFVIGFTATAHRRKPQRPLKDYYESIILGPSVKELIDLKFLTPSIVFGKKLDMSNIGVRAGEYKAEDQHEQFKVQGMYGAAIDHYQKIMMSKKTLAFTPSIESSQMLTEFFNATGIPAAHVDGTTPARERESIFKLFREGEIKVLSNVEIATTGFDDPTVEGIILLLSTRSLVKYLQILGRGSRIAPDKTNFTVLDFGNNTQRHGFYDDDREWSLELDTTDFRKEPNTTKICPECSAVIRIFDRECPHCGHKFTGEEVRPIIVEEMKVELEPLLRNEDILRLADTKSFMELSVIAELKGWKQGWVFYQLQNKEDLIRYMEYVKKKDHNAAVRAANWMVKEKGWKPLTFEERLESLNNYKKSKRDHWHY